MLIDLWSKHAALFLPLNWLLCALKKYGQCLKGILLINSFFWSITWIVKKCINQTHVAQRTFTETSIKWEKAAFWHLLWAPLELWVSACVLLSLEARGQGGCGTSCIMDPPQHKKVTYLKMSVVPRGKNHIFFLY